RQKIPAPPVAPRWLFDSPTPYQSPTPYPKDLQPVIILSCGQQCKAEKWFDCCQLAMRYLHRRDGLMPHQQINAAGCVKCYPVLVDYLSLHRVDAVSNAHGSAARSCQCRAVVSLAVEASQQILQPPFNIMLLRMISTIQLQRCNGY